MSTVLSTYPDIIEINDCFPAAFLVYFPVAYTQILLITTLRLLMAIVAGISLYDLFVVIKSTIAFTSNEP